MKSFTSAIVTLAVLVAAPQWAGAQSSPKRTVYVAPELQRATMAEQRVDLELVFGLRTGEYLSDVHVTLQDERGRLLLETVADTPFLALSLPRGRYKVNATFGGQTISKSIAVDGARPLTHEFHWGSYTLGGSHTLGAVEVGRRS